MTDSVQQIKDKLSILDVVAPYVELHKAGKSYKGKSPFTQERTPSFFVSPDRGMYYCFSTSQGGDMFTFIQAMEGVDFKGALKILAEKAGVELVREDPKKRDERDQQYALIEAATKYFESERASHTGAIAYLKKRGVEAKTIGAWRIGYAPGPPERGWRELRDHLTGLGYTDAQMHAAGLVKTAEKGKAPYDVFRDRIMFPICDPSGRVIAFSGRILSKESDAPKYVNSPETTLFNKSEVLFGYDKAKHGIRKFDFSLIVEGQFDVVLSHQAGYTNAVAVSGTALTQHHVALLGRLSNRVVLALDADRAGIAAVKRAADLMLARGMDVKVARLPEGEDPADLVQEDPKRFKETIGHAVHVIEFLIAVIKESARDERTFKLQARDEVVPYLMRIESSIDREHFEGVVADALDTTRDAIRLEIARLERSRKHEPASAEPDTTQTVQRDAPDSRYDGLVQYCAAVFDIIDDTTRDALAEAFADITGTELSDTRTTLSAEVVSPLSFRIEAEFAELSPDRIRSEIASRLTDLHTLTVKAKIREKREALTLAEREGADDAYETLMAELTELHKTLDRPTVNPDTFKTD